MLRITSDKNDGKTAILSKSRISEVGIALYSWVQMSSVLGLTDLFTTANKLSVERAGANARELRISHWQAKQETDRFERIFDTHQFEMLLSVG